MLPVQQFIDHIRQQQLFAATDRILLTVSGGKDSVVMAHLFKLAGFHFSIAHCNFNLRGAEAQRDESFVRLLAQEMDVPFHVAHFDTKTFAAQHKISIQMAARQLRYQWFEQLRVAIGYDYIALAHHQNDAIETVLLNLVRGTGISGMHGIAPKRGRLIRPLLFLSRLEIDRLVAMAELPYVEDSSNQSSKYARNNIRLNVIPHLKAINPQLEETFTQNISRFAETALLLQDIVKQKAQSLFEHRGNDIYIEIAQVRELYPQKLLFFELLKAFDFTDTLVDEVLAALDKQSGTSFYSHTHRLTIDRLHLILSVIEKTDNEIFYLHGEQSLSLPHGKLISLKITENMAFSTARDKAFVDADLLVFPLVIRYKLEGDKFRPLGMKTNKKLSDFFIDQKVPLIEKQKIPLLINGNGEMIWVAGMRQDERYKVTTTTKKVAIFELSNLSWTADTLT